MPGAHGEPHMAVPHGQTLATSKPNSNPDPTAATQLAGLQPAGKEVQDSIHSRPGTLSMRVPSGAGRQSSSRALVSLSMSLRIEKPLFYPH